MMRTTGWLRASGLFLIVGMTLLTGCGSSTKEAAVPVEEVPAAVEQDGNQQLEAEEVQARVDNFLAQVEEKVQLNQDQLNQLREVAQEYFANTARMLQRQGLGGTAQGKGPLSEEERSAMAEMRGAPGQQRQKLTDELHRFLSDEQVEAVLGVWEDIRREMFIERTIQEIGGSAPDGDK